MAFLWGGRLLDWASSPPHLQFNRFVLTGYRPVSSGSGCFRSLFYLHNELGNIYTHGIPLLGFLFVLPLTIPWAQLSESWLGVVHYLACIFPQMGSVLYHLFMNHERGPAVYHTLLTLGMCGVCMVNTLGALPIIYCTLACSPLLRSIALLAYTGLSSYEYMDIADVHSF
ncbi:progestin and adipoQ receptor family member 4-like [Pseudonaja textilis]|uniref:progestin and adipoQ receptor family member 4-like n=1 Tax=Pseudonaja textilis TaxID=8673 RepID=UPI000EA89CB3|nr:progestin and adipoQ receptor family member 4-like [Pseudonaja textilis]